MPSSTSSSEPRRRRWPAGLLLALAGFAAIEGVVWSNERWVAVAARYTPAGPDGDPLLIDAALRRLPDATEGALPLLLLGSSQIREGLDCPLIENRHGRPCRNLAISAGSPLDMLSIQGRYDARLPRRATVVGVFPKVMHMAPKTGFVDGGTVATLIGTRSTWRIGARGWVELSAGLLQTLSPTLRFKDALWELWGVVQGRVGAARSLRLAPAPKRLLAGEHPKPPIYFERRIGRLDPDVTPGIWTSAQERALERLIAREVARGNPLVVVDFPTRPGYETTIEDAIGTEYQELTARLRVTPGIVFVEADELGPLELEDFQDFTHLSQRGRERVSERLADRVEAELTRHAAPRTVG